MTWLWFKTGIMRQNVACCAGNLATSLHWHSVLSTLGHNLSLFVCKHMCRGLKYHLTFEICSILLIYNWGNSEDIGWMPEKSVFSGIQTTSSKFPHCRWVKLNKPQMWGHTLVPCNAIYKHRDQRFRTMVVTKCVSVAQLLEKLYPLWHTFAGQNPIRLVAHCLKTLPFVALKLAKMVSYPSHSRVENSCWYNQWFQRWLWQSPIGKQVWHTELQCEDGSGRFLGITQTSRFFKIVGITHHKPFPKNMCHTHGWPEQWISRK